MVRLRAIAGAVFGMVGLIEDRPLVLARGAMARVNRAVPIPRGKIERMQRPWGQVVGDRRTPMACEGSRQGMEKLKSVK